MSVTYLNLIQSFPPRPIRSAQDFEATQAVVNNLLDTEALTADEEDYLEVLGTLIYEYEQQQGDIIPDIHGVELLQVLIEENELKQKDLVPIFKTESIVSAVLNGKRQLTTRHIQELAAFFHVSPAVFFPANSSGDFLIA
ncbi:transcriptional regulator [Synechocystis sp. FACHB-383]|uniref:helix-turn-helix domain-containing protein n=1 Tax=Synechocystis sp. FACHB-383 TaxID=2692864 RepID=UPI001684001B|nr:transcriptional regulator [Synechocystis sp. FACHB-383]MBD2654387.1 transcriptional regulator [Synechocystis sp. FACHB-383]